MLQLILHVAAFIICLGVQSMGSPLAGAWLPFFLAGCAVLLYKNKALPSRSPLWRACALWAIVATSVVFFVNPIPGSASALWVILAMPLLTMCLGKEQLPTYVKGFGGVIAIYAFGLFFVFQSTD